MPVRTPVVGRARLELTITVTNQRGKDVQTKYAVIFLAPNAEVANPAWRMVKLLKAGALSDVSYDVALLPHGPECTCPDFNYCRDHKDEKGCKHIASLRKAGMLWRYR